MKNVSSRRGIDTSSIRSRSIEFSSYTFPQRTPLNFFFHSIIYRTVSVYSLDRSAIANRVSSRCENPARTLSTFSSYFLYLSYYFFVQIFLRSSYTIEYYFIFREVSRSWLIERNRLLLLVNDLFEKVKNDLSNFVILFFFLLSVND